MKKNLSHLLIISILSLVFVACTNQDNKKPTNSAKPQTLLKVKTFKIEDKKALTSKIFPAVVKPYEEVNITARVKGILKAKHFKEGSFVKKGSLLYEIESDIYKSNLAFAKAAYEKTNVTLKKLEKDKKRAEALIKNDSISVQEYDEYILNYEEAKNEFNKAKATLKNAQIELSYTKIYSPIDGIAGVKQKEIGDLVGSNENNSFLLTITNTNPVYAEFSISNEDVSRYLEQIKNAKAKISLIKADNKTKDGVVDFISPKIDTNTDSLLIRAKFDNSNEELIIGEFIKIKISNLDLRDVIIVPEIAIMKTAKGDFVYLNKENIAKFTPITSSILVNEGVVVTKGLTTGDEIIVTNLSKLRPDTKIEIIKDEKQE